MAPRAQEAVSDWRAAETLGDLTGIASYRFATSDRSVKLHSLAYDDNGKFWQAIFANDEMTENCRVELHRFWLTEWMPLRPGLFHTDRARIAREEAIRDARILPNDRNAPRPLLQFLGKRRNRQPTTMLFNPDGKMGMVDGGVGCVRLKPMPNRKSHRWAFGASSSKTTHEGVPIALDDAERDRLITDVRKRGGLLCNMSGILRFVPRDDPMELMFGRGIPQLYIEIDRVDPDPLYKTVSEQIEVSAAVTFLAGAEKYRGLKVSYVTFDPGHDGDLPAAAEWLDAIYVRESYGGRILTDFDEQTRHFDQASFGLHKLLNGLVSRVDAVEIDAAFGANHRLVELLDRRKVFIAGDLYGDIFIAENVAAMGPNARAASTRFSINKRDPDE